MSLSEDKGLMNSKKLIYTMKVMMILVKMLACFPLVYMLGHFSYYSLVVATNGHTDRMNILFIKKKKIESVFLDMFSFLSFQILCIYSYTSSKV